MSWENARNSADLLAERLNRIDGVSDPTSSALTTSLSQPVYTRGPTAAAIVPAIAPAISADEPIVPDDEARRGGDGAIDERRIDPRTSQKLDAAISVPGRPDALPARIVDMSVSGARIELQDHAAAADLPDRFMLTLHRDSSEVECQIIWRTHTYVGALFLAAPRSMPGHA